MNVRRGLNRLFVVASIAWSLYVVFVLPSSMHASALHNRDAAYFELQGEIERAAGNPFAFGSAPMRDILQARVDLWQQEADSWTGPAAWLTVDMLPWLLGFIILPLAGLYVLGVTGWFVSRWVLRGFTGARSDDAPEGARPPE